MCCLYALTTSIFFVFLDFHSFNRLQIDLLVFFCNNLHILMVFIAPSNLNLIAARVVLARFVIQDDLVLDIGVVQVGWQTDACLQELLARLLELMLNFLLFLVDEFFHRDVGDA